MLDNEVRQHSQQFYSEDEIRRLRRRDRAITWGLWLLFLGALALLAVENDGFQKLFSYVIANFWVCLASWFAISILMVLPFGIANWNRKQTQNFEKE